MYGFWLVLLINSVLLGIYMVSNVYKFVKTIINYPPICIQYTLFHTIFKVFWMNLKVFWMIFIMRRWNYMVFHIIFKVCRWFSLCVKEGTLPFFFSKFVELYKNSPLYVENLSFRNVFSIFVSNHVKVYSGTFSVPPPFI